MSLASGFVLIEMSDEASVASVVDARKFGITESLKRVEAAGFDEVILYFNVGLKPHAQVLEEMSRFAEQVAPAFG